MAARFSVAFASLLAALLVSACGSTSTESVTGPSAPKCSVSLAGPGESISASGGAGTIVVSTQPECEWTATAEASWIEELTPTQGQGNGQVQFQVVPNPNGTTREGAVNVNGQRAAIRQSAAACEISLSASATQFAAAGGAGTIAVTAPGGCAWTAGANVGWTVVSPAAGSGSGTVNFTVAGNPGPARTGAITIGGVTVTIAQNSTDTSPPCVVTLQPTSASVAAAGGPGTVAITAAVGCSWTANSLAPWITLTTPTTGSGNGSVGFSVAANTAATARTGNLNIGGTTFTVNQAGAPQTCTINIDPTSQSVPAAGAAGITVAVSTAAGCTWTSTSQSSWLTITAGASGSGNGTVALTAAANTGGARTGTATIGGRTFTVNQAAFVSQCSYSINPTAQTVGSEAGTGSPIAVTAGAGCAWTATSNVPWLAITTGASGSGNGSVVFDIAANTGPSRTGTITIGGQTFTVDQAGICVYSINPTSRNFNKDGGTDSVAVTAPGGCGWTATTSAGFITITAGATGTGNGTVTYRVSSYNGNGTRTGTITIAGQAFTVTQKK